MISIDNEQEKEDTLLFLMEEAKKYKDELEDVGDILRQLEKGFTEGRISAKQ